MALILSIDTSTTACSVALHKEGKLLANSELFAEKSTSQMLTTLINDVLNHASIEKSDLSAISVAKGPGSYTGLRIGVSTAKGLCFGLDIPLLSYNTLEAMSYNFIGKGEFLICPMLDARRMEVYCAFYENSSRTEFLVTSAEVINEKSFEDILKTHKVIFLGEGSHKCRAVIVNENAIFLEEDIHPRAALAGKLSYSKFINQDFEDLVGFEPFYLKEFMATIPKKQKML